MVVAQVLRIRNLQMTSQILKWAQVNQRGKGTAGHWKTCTAALGPKTITHSDMVDSLVWQWQRVYVKSESQKTIVRKLLQWSKHESILPWTKKPVIMKRQDNYIHVILKVVEETGWIWRREGRGGEGRGRGKRNLGWLGFWLWVGRGVRRMSSGLKSHTWWFSA